jgi:hypothetical protein
VIVRFGDCVISPNCEITKSPNHKIWTNFWLLKRSVYSEVLATCKTLQSRALRLGGIALNSSQPWRWDLPFIGLLSDVPGIPADSISVRLNPADCQPLSSSSFIPQQQHIGARAGVLFFGAGGCGKNRLADVAAWRASGEPAYNPFRMRIISVEPAPVALVFAIIYAPLGLIAFAIYAFSSLQTFALPIGIFMGIFHLNLNFPLPRTSDLLGNVFQAFAAVVSFAVSGWITGAVFALSFNFVAQKTGGIDAKFVLVADEHSDPTT